jgi:deazaflavin-dependent oxidoreductase (nitroreductase family)
MAVTDRRPAGALRMLLRAPVWLYRAHLGLLAGHRLAYIVHRGCKTGARRDVVAEVAHFDPDTPRFVVIAAWGRNPDWYRNLCAGPALEVRIGGRRWPHPAHHFPDATETQDIPLAYQRKHPRAWRRLAPLLGFPTHPDDPRWPEVSATVHAIGFTPDHSAVPPAD